MNNLTVTRVLPEAVAYRLVWERHPYPLVKLVVSVRPFDRFRPFSLERDFDARRALPLFVSRGVEVAVTSSFKARAIGVDELRLLER